MKRKMWYSWKIGRLARMNTANGGNQFVGTLDGDEIWNPVKFLPFSKLYWRVN